MEKEDYVSLDVAKLLKEKGYDEDCNILVAEECWSFNKGKLTCVDKDREFCPFPTLYEAAKWLWQEHELLVNAFLEAPFGKPYQFIYCIQDAKNTLDDYGTIVSDKSFSSFEEALNAGILEALKMI